MTPASALPQGASPRTVSVSGGPAPAWHALPPAECLARLDAHSSGLDAAEVRSRRERDGANILPQAARSSPLILLLRQFRSPLIYLLLGAAAFSLAIGHAGDAGFIFAILLLNALIGAVQEGRAGAAAQALEAMVRQTARVRRAGRTGVVDAADLVAGDILLLESGDRISADARLLDSRGLHVDESLLTGEALPVAKDAGARTGADTPAADRVTMAHAGTMVVEGRATALVVAIGENTQIGAIGTALASARAVPPPLVVYLERLSRQIAVATVVLILLLGIAMAARGAGVYDILLLAVAPAVSAIPEGLPIAVTVTLAAATSRMAKRNVIVRTLPAVEGLGACTLIATDKTGTLTRNELSVEAVLLPDGARIDRPGWCDVFDRLEPIARAAVLCNEAERTAGGEPVGDSVDVALLRFGGDVGIDGEGAVREALFAYEPVNRFASAAVRVNGRTIVYAKGAVETVAEMCDHADPALIAAAERLAGDGFRVLALAGRDVTRLDECALSAPSGLALLGCVALLDPLRDEAIEAVRQCRGAGIDVRMVTGDHPATARTIARQLGLDIREDAVVTGADLRALEHDPAAFDARVAAAKVFARTEPAQKLRIVETLQRAGHFVAVTGDGVNDAPALQAAQIGVAMGRGGTDVARGASDLILTDDNFASIVAGVEEGRITFANLRKIVIFLLASAIAEIGMFLGAVLVGLPMPLTAVQLLWSNLVTNGVQDVGLAFGRGEGDELTRPPRGAGNRLLDRRALTLMIAPALAMAVAALLLFEWQLDRGKTLAEAQNAVLLATVLFQNVFVLSMRSERRPIWRTPVVANPLLALGVAAALLLHLGAMTLPFLQEILGTGLPDAPMLLLCGAIAGLVLLVSEATKAVLKRR